MEILFFILLLIIIFIEIKDRYFPFLFRNSLIFSTVSLADVYFKFLFENPNEKTIRNIYARFILIGYKLPPFIVTISRRK